MKESILEQSKKAKKMGLLGLFFNKKFIVPLFLIVVSVVTYLVFFKNEDDSKTAVATQKEWTVKKDDLRISVESDGNVIAEDGVELSFSINGEDLEVEEVFVQEGSKVEKGDKIATVSTEDLEYDLQKEYASYQSTLASYNEEINGASNEDIEDSLNSIEQAELSLEQAKASLEKTKYDAEKLIKNAEEAVEDAKKDLDDYEYEDDNEEDIEDALDDIVNYVKSADIDLNNILEDSDEVLGIDDVYINDSFEYLLGAKSGSALNVAKASYNSSKKAYDSFVSDVLLLSDSDSEEEIVAMAEELDEVFDIFEEHLYDMQVLLENTITADELSQTQLNSFKSTISSNRLSINNEIDDLDSKFQSLDDAKSNWEDYDDDYEDALSDYEEAYQDALEDLEDAKIEAERDIADAEMSVTTKELSLENANSSYERLLAPLTESELASLKSKLTSASISLQQAKNNVAKATLESPIAGEVVLLNYKVGDIILDDSNEPVVEIMNSDTLYIEVSIEEVDINKLETGQRAIATFDAIEEAELEGEISFISLTSETSTNGVVTYTVRITFDNSADYQIREGMTAFVEFITAGADDVLVVPVSAVRNVNDMPSVELESGEWAEVVTGFTDGDYVEIISGLSEGDKIVY